MEYIPDMSVLSATSIARVQTLTKQLSPAPVPSPEFEGLSEDQRDDLAAVRRLQRPLFSGTPNIATYSGVAPLQLTVQDGKVGFSNDSRSDSNFDGTLGSLVSASYGANDLDTVDSPILDLLA